MKFLLIIIFSGMAFQLSAQINVINSSADKSITISPRGITSDIPQNESNVALGEYALINIGIGSSNIHNTAIGFSSLKYKVSGIYNTAVGTFSQLGGGSISPSNTGSRNTSLGYSSLRILADGGSNSSISHYSGSKMTSGNNNSLLGFYAGQWITTGSGNLMLGSEAGGTTNVSNKLFIANTDTDNPLIKGDFSTGEVKINNKLKVGGTGDTPTATLQVSGNYAISGQTLMYSSANNYDLNGKSVIQISGGLNITLTGIAGGVEGMIIHIIVANNSDLTLANYSSLSLPDNHIRTGSNGDIVISQGGGATLIYDIYNNDWVVIGIKN